MSDELECDICKYIDEWGKGRMADEKFIECKLCKKKFKRISNTHLGKVHGITCSEYREQFLDAAFDSEDLSRRRKNSLRGKSYEEQFGFMRAKEMKEKHKNKAIEQMKDPKQREIRRSIIFDTKTRKLGKEKMKKTKRSTDQYNCNNYRERGLSHYGTVCQRCGKEFPKQKLVVHHKDCSNYQTELANHNMENLMVLCRSCHSKLHNEIRRTSTRYIGQYDIEKGMHLILKGLRKEFGLKIKDQHFIDTPRRVARAYVEIFAGIENTEKQVEEILGTAFKSDMDQMIVAKDLHVFSMCPHHFLPVEYYISVAYIPNGYVLGLSKLARLAEVLARRPVIQEQLVSELTNYLMKIEPLGAAARISGQHFCMRMRGVNKPEATVTTTSVLGAFKENQATREEFLLHIGK